VREHSNVRDGAIHTAWLSDRGRAILEGADEPAQKNLGRISRDRSTVKAGRNRLIANNEVRSHPLNRPAGARFGISAEELFIEGADLHFGESRPETEVLTGSEPDMRRLGTSDVKAIWFGEDRFVTITRAIPENYLVARTDRLIADLREFDCSPPHMHHGADPTHYLRSRTAKQCWMLDQTSPLSGMIREREKAP
jgi:hypothetical protein